jgi:hypothetical protein
MVRKFWLLLSGLFAAQSIIGFLVLGAVERVPAMVWALLIPLNYFVLGATLAYFLPSQRHARSRNRV